MSREVDFSGTDRVGKNEITDENKLYEMTDFFKALSDPTRIKILLILFESEFCVGELAGRLNMTDSAVSHQLHILKAGRLVKKRREGKMMIYSLADRHVRSIIKQGLEHAAE